MSDAGADLYTLKRFKGQVVRMVKPEYQRAFRERLKVAWGESSVRDLLRRARNLRDTRIAHFHQSFVQKSFDPVMQQEYLLFSEVGVLRDKLNMMVQALAFANLYGMLPLSYDMGHADVDDVLDRLARTSELLNMPERNPVFWQQMRSGIGDEQIEVLNRYRREFSLEEI